MPEKNTLRLYPNPASTELVIHHKIAKGSEQLQIISMKGTLAIQSNLQAGTTATRFAELKLAKGLYFVVILDGKQNFTQPLLIQ